MIRLFDEYDIKKIFMSKQAKKTLERYLYKFFHVSTQFYIVWNLAQSYFYNAFETADAKYRDIMKLTFV